MLQCEKCGKELDDDMSFCPSCGSPITQKTDAEDIPEEINPSPDGPADTPPLPENVKQKKSKKVIWAIACVVLVVAIAAAAIAVVMINRYNTQKELQEQQAALELYMETYRANLKSATYKILEGCVAAEKAGNLINKVWYNAIHKEWDPDTNQYTRPHAYFYEDFNDALNELFRNSSFNSTLSDIKANQDAVKALMKELRNPPEEYEEAYDQLKEYYDVYLEFTDMVISPTGSYNSFSSGFSDADARVLKAYHAMELYIDD